MKKSCILFLILSGFITMNSCKNTIKYPTTKKMDIVDNYFGQKVPDPYRWLENDTSKETAEWVKQENTVTFNYLDRIPYREKIRKEFQQIWNYPKYGVPLKKGPWYFFRKNDGLQNQSVLYVMKGLDDTPRILLDPNKFSPDGTVALDEISPSKDGKYLAFTIARSGSDWNEICLIEISSGKVLPDTLKWVKFSGMAWKGDGFYYSRYDEPKPGQELAEQNKNHKVYFHKAGTSQKEDILVYENLKYPERNYEAGITEDERFLFIYESETTSGNALYFKDLSKPSKSFKLLAPGFDYEYNVVDNLGDKLLVMTNYKAPKKKLILMDPETPEPSHWRTIIPERDDVLESAEIAGDKIVSIYMQNIINKAFIYDFKGKFIDELKLPDMGTLAGFNSHKGDNKAFYGFTSFRYPLTIFSYDIKTNKSVVFRKPDLHFNADDFEVKQVFYSSKDNTTIPMFLVYKKGIRMDGQNPVLLYGYGGFNISLTPDFKISRMLFLENGGIYAVANLRGGGEFGEDWHKAGIKENKQNVFDDFIAAAQYLISEKYTSPEKLAIMGGSNGGLLIGAVMTQHPELFKVAIPQVGVMDMLRYHKFTIGHAWAGDYGTSETKEGFSYLIKYSPLHNLKKGVKYPATLALTADHDDRVVPAHTFKFMATLQEDNAGSNPVLLRVETKAGHGAGKPTSMQIDEAADIWSFIFYNLGMKFSGSSESKK
ncbi:MAG: prolyl oligopeptidase family serine peptidase [Bacteroidota bacterium]|nr:prolyl oligopeptidase family serine peptidase [Bacteroidota bacterium]